MGGLVYKRVRRDARPPTLPGAAGVWVQRYWTSEGHTWWTTCVETRSVGEWSDCGAVNEWTVVLGGVVEWGVGV